MSEQFIEPKPELDFPKQSFVVRAIFFVGCMGILLLGFGHWLKFPMANQSAFGTRTRAVNSTLLPRPNHPEVSENTEAQSERDWLRLRNPLTSPIPSDIHARELAFALTLPTAPTTGTSFKASAQPFGNSGIQTTGTDWKSVGPTNVGGRTQALVFDAANENTILAASAQGGVWRSTDRGLSWNITTLPNQLHDAMSLAQDTRVGKQNVWYYGTGELLSTTWRRASVVSGPRWRTQDIGDGIYKSIDSGKSWSILPSTVSGPTTALTQPFNGVWTIVTDGHDQTDDLLYAACYGSVMRSTNGGGSWTNVLGDPKNLSYCTDITISSQGILYAAMSTETLTGTNSSTAGIWRSTDGLHWQRINPTSGWPGETRRMKLALAPSNENVLYTIMETPGFGTSDHSIWKYTYSGGDGTGSGGTWSDRSSTIPYDATGNQPNMSFNSLGGYALIIKVKPDDENTVFIGGTNFVRSTDGFATLQNEKWLGGYGSAATPNFTDHPDNHAIAFLPSDPKVIFTGTDGGMFTASDDTRPDTIHWQPVNTGYTSTMFYSVAMDHTASNDNFLVGGLQDNYSWGGWDSLNNWSSLGGGDGCYSGVSDTKHYLYTSSQFAYITQFTLDAQLNLTGVSFIAPYDATYTFVAPWELDPNNTNIMYLAGGRMLWRNNNLAGMTVGNYNYTTQNWDHLTNSMIPSLGASDYAVIGCISLSTLPANRLYYGTSDGRLFKLDNANTGDQTPTEITSPIFPKNAYIANVAIDRENADNIIAVFSNYGVISLFASSNAGATWRNISGNLEQNPDGSGDGPSCRWAAIIHRGMSTIYYVGTSAGLYSTTDINASSPVWSQEGVNTIGNSTVEMIDYRETDGEIAIATEGRGVFVATAPSAVAAHPEVKMNDQLGISYPNPSSSTMKIPFELATEERVSLSLIDESGKPLMELFHGVLSKGNHVIPCTTSGLAEGTYFYSLSTPSMKATKRFLVLR